MGDNLEVALFDQRFEAGIADRLRRPGRRAGHGRRPALRERRRAGRRRRARRARGRRPARRPGHGRLLLHDGQQLQRQPPDPGGLRGRRRSARSSCAARRGTTCSPATSTSVERREMAAIRQPLREQVLRRKPVTAMTAETGADSGHGRAGALDRALPALDVRRRRHDRHRHLHRALAGGPGRRARGDLVVRHRRHRRRADGHLLRRAGRAPCRSRARRTPTPTPRWARASAMVVAACLLLEYGVSAAAVAVGWSQYLNELLDNLFGFTIPDALVAGAGAGRHLQPARRDPDRAVHAAADPRRERVGEGQRGHGDDQARRAGRCSSCSACRAGTPTTCRTSRRSASTASRSAAGIIFFSYIGLDAVSTAGEEVKNPRRTMPLAIIIALVDRHRDLHRW